MSAASSRGLSNQAALNSPSACPCYQECSFSTIGKVDCSECIELDAGGQCSWIRSSFSLVIQGESMKRKLLAVFVLVGAADTAYAHAVPPPPPPALTLTVSPATVQTGGSSTAILVEWSGIPNPTPGDWLGIYPAGVAPHGFAVGNPMWKYVDCQQHVGAGSSAGAGRRVHVRGPGPGAGALSGKPPRE